MNEYQILIGCILLSLGNFGCTLIAFENKSAEGFPSDLLKASIEPSSVLELKEEEKFNLSSSLFFPPVSESPYPDISEATELSIELLDYLYENVEELDVCDRRLDFIANRRYPRIYKVAEQRYIVELVCVLGAYQIGYQYYLYENQTETVELTPLILDRFRRERSGNSSGEWIRYRSRDIGAVRVYDAERKIFNFFSKGTGISTCGHFARYQWDDAMSGFQLLEYRVKEDCHKPIHPPEQYPLIYQTSSPES